MRPNFFCTETGKCWFENLLSLLQQNINFISCNHSLFTWSSVYMAIQMTRKWQQVPRSQALLFTVMLDYVGSLLSSLAMLMSWSLWGAVVEGGGPYAHITTCYRWWILNVYLPFWQWSPALLTVGIHEAGELLEEALRRQQRPVNLLGHLDVSLAGGLNIYKCWK